MKPHLTAANFTQRAEAILSQVQKDRAEHGLRAAMEDVAEKFIDMEPHPQLRRLGEVLGLARQQAMVQVGLDADREALHHGNLSHEQNITTGHHYEMLRHAACTYNHLLRGLIESSSEFISRDNLIDWLSAVSGGRKDWAKGEVTGAVSEIALHAALQGLPELKNMRYGSVEEDLMGYDFVGDWQGKVLTVDAKSGLYSPISEIKHGHRHLEISVPHEAVNGLTVNHRGLTLLRREVRQALLGDSGAQMHAPHHYFQLASNV